MPKSRKLEELQTLLSQVRADPTTPEAIVALRKIFKSKTAMLMVPAAKIVVEQEIRELIPDLVAAFHQCLEKPMDSDPGCRAKIAIAEALYQLEYSEEGLFLTGIRWIQLEPMWGGSGDTASQLRSTCALGLVRMHYPQVMVELADLLADPAPDARIGAARAIAYSENPAGVPLLRLRVHVGDEPAVLTECLLALLELAPTESLELVKKLLHTRQPPLNLEENVEVAEPAAMALGESRVPEAFDILQKWWSQVRAEELRKSGLMAIALVRHDLAIAFLLDQIANGRLDYAKDAIAALAIYRSDDVLWEKVSQHVSDRDVTSLSQALARYAQS